jgi:hypothetical protein
MAAIFGVWSDFLLDIYAKSEKGDLSSQEKKMMNAMVDELIESYGG